MKKFGTLIFGAVLLLQAFLVLATAHWFFELWTHYLHYIVCFDLLAIGFFIVFKEWRWIALILVFLQMNTWPLIPYLQKQIPPHTEPEFTVLSSNFYYANEHQAEFLEQVQRGQADIIVVHEATAMWEGAFSLEDYPTQGISTIKGIPGIFIASRVPGEITEVPLGDGFGLELQTATFNILAVHPFPSMTATWHTSAKAYYTDMTRYAKSHENTILIGDFNATPWSPKFHKLLQETGLRDARLGFGFLASWHSNNPLFHIPIDHALLNPKWAVLNFETLYIEGSDHRAIMLQFSTENVSR